MTTTDTGPRIGELFAGYGGLGMGVQAVTGGRVVWVSEFDDGPSAVLAHRLPDAPNHGDITRIDWSTVEPIGILTGGFPCQDVSAAGKRAGLREGTRSGLWHEFARAVRELRPPLVVIENVRGLLTARGAESDELDAADHKVTMLRRAVTHLTEMRDRARTQGDTTRARRLNTHTVRVMGQRDRAMAARRRAERRLVRALGTVLGTLADLGYDTVWHSLRAADIGAPHGRFRVFIVAYPKGNPWRLPHRDTDAAPDPGRSGRGEAVEQDGRRSPADHRAGVPHQPDRDADGTRPVRAGQLLPTPRTSDGTGPGVHGDGGLDLSTTVALLPTPMSRDWRTGYEAGGAPPHRVGTAPLNDVVRDFTQWGDYAAAITAWEFTLDRSAPYPTVTSAKGSPQLSARFVEWMMGLPEGWVTDVPGITRNQALKALGNGVCPQQAAAAVAWCLTVATTYQER